MNILLSGATGYIGSNIAENLLRAGHSVYATCRDRSSFDKCAPFATEITWLNQDSNDWQKSLENIDLDLLIHTAWAGVSASDRNNWDVQLSNFYFSKMIIDLSLQLNVKKIICLGSQAEYGEFDYKVTEEHIPCPMDAYGAVKLLTLNYLRNIALKSKPEWYWLRVFSIIGKNENEMWLLPQVMKNLLDGNEIELTEGGQCYDYLYMDDFIVRLNQVINTEIDNSGVYNICSGRVIQIRQMLQLVTEKLNVPVTKLKFGAIPYREHQNMFMVGSSEKFEAKFGVLALESLEDSVSKITTFYRRKQK